MLPLRNSPGGWVGQNVTEQLEKSTATVEPGITLLAKSRTVTVKQHAPALSGETPPVLGHVEWLGSGTPSVAANGGVRDGRTSTDSNSSSSAAKRRGRCGTGVSLAQRPTPMDESHHRRVRGTRRCL